MDDEFENDGDEPFVCDWCGVYFNKSPYLTKRRTKHYCSLDCGRVRDFFVFAIMSTFGFVMGILILLTSHPEKFSISLLGIILGFVFFVCSFDVWRIRRKTPRDSRRGLHIDNIQ